MLYKKTVVETRRECMGGEGVGRVGRYLWYTPSSEKAKLTIPERTKWKRN
jgi:hypothetical protein